VILWEMLYVLYISFAATYNNIYVDFLSFIAVLCLIFLFYCLFLYLFPSNEPLIKRRGKYCFPFTFSSQAIMLICPINTILILRKNRYIPSEKTNYHLYNKCNLFCTLPGLFRSCIILLSPKTLHLIFLNNIVLAL